MKTIGLLGASLYSERWADATQLLQRFGAPNAIKLPKLRPAELRALLLCRDNLEGGDPDMSRVTSATMQKLSVRGLVAGCFYDDCEGYPNFHRRVFERSHIPTRLGLAVLDAATYGPRP